MAAEKYLSTQSAILIAGALIAAGLFFGLRGREPPPASGPAVSVPGSGTLVSSPAPTPPPAPPAPSAAAPDRAIVMAAAMKELERHRAAVVEKCVKPALAQRPSPPQIKLGFDVTFDPQGKQIARGVSEDRETRREGVSTCAMETLPELQVPAPGAHVRVELPWTLP
jgi:hypothetical protein